MSDISHRALEQHRRLRGKVEVVSKAEITDAEALSMYYTPGVGAVSRRLGEHPEESAQYTWKSNTVAIVSDGSAVLGLGNVGPLAALPVMEGKAMIFKQFGGLNGVPIVLGTQNPDEVVAAVTAIAPGFAGINLEDIAAPACFEIERRIQEALDMPVMHDDQHGTAIVVLAGLINAAQVVGKDPHQLKIAMVGAGAAGTGIAKLLLAYGIGSLAVADRRGLISLDRGDLRDEKCELAELTQRRTGGEFAAGVAGADVVIGVSGPGSISSEHVRSMAADPIVFALANPESEIMPGDARAAGAAVVATGRSDFPNQINNALVFPGVFKGAIAGGVKKITTEHKLAAARALAAVVERPTADEIIPSIFNPKVVPAIAAAIK